METKEKISTLQKKMATVQTKQRNAMLKNLERIYGRTQLKKWYPKDYKRINAKVKKLKDMMKHANDDAYLKRKGYIKTKRR